MTDELLARCELFARNVESMKDNFRWEAPPLYALCANLYTTQGVDIDPEKIKIAKEIIKDNTSFFSNFRGTTTATPLATLLSMDASPITTFEEIRVVYNGLKEVFSSSSYLTLAAYLIVKFSSPQEHSEIINQAGEIYNMMKKEHFFLTSSEDCITAVQFALCQKQSQELIRKSENCFEILKSEMNGGNTVQAISNTLALSDNDADKLCKKFLDIINNLRSHGYKLTNGVELSILAALATTDISLKQIVNDILEVKAYLITVKGFGNIVSESKIMDQKLLPKRRIMHSALIVLNEYAKELKDNQNESNALNNTVAKAEIMATLYTIVSFSPSNA